MDSLKKTFGIVRQLDSLGRIVIPKETRDLLGIRLEDPVEFFSDDHAIIVRRYRSNCCIFCLDSDDLIHFRGKFICKPCMTEALSQTPEVVSLDTSPSTGHKHQSRTDKLNLLRIMLLDNPNLRQQELAKMLGISQGYVSQLLRKMHTL